METMPLIESSDRQRLIAFGLLLVAIFLPALGCRENQKELAVSSKLAIYAVYDNGLIKIRLKNLSKKKILLLVNPEEFQGEVIFYDGSNEAIHAVTEKRLIQLTTSSIGYPLIKLKPSQELKWEVHFGQLRGINQKLHKDIRSYQSFSVNISNLTIPRRSGNYIEGNAAISSEVYPLVK